MQKTTKVFQYRVDAEWAMTGSDQGRSACPWIVNLTVTDGVILPGHINLLDLVGGLWAWLRGAMIHMVSAV